MGRSVTASVDLRVVGHSRTPFAINGSLGPTEARCFLPHNARLQGGSLVPAGVRVARARCRCARLVFHFRLMMGLCWAHLTFSVGLA